MPKTAGKLRGKVRHTGLKVIKAAIILYPDCPCKRLLHEIVEAVKDEEIDEPYTEHHARTDLANIMCCHNV